MHLLTCQTLSRAAPSAAEMMPKQLKLAQRNGMKIAEMEIRKKVALSQGPIRKEQLMKVQDKVASKRSSLEEDMRMETEKVRHATPPTCSPATVWRIPHRS